MATLARVDSGATTTYTITDMGGSTVTITVTTTPVAGNTVQFSSSGGLRADGLAMLSDLMLSLTTGLLPPASVPAY